MSCGCHTPPSTTPPTNGCYPSASCVSCPVISSYSRPALTPGQVWYNPATGSMMLMGPNGLTPVSPAPGGGLRVNENGVLEVVFGRGMALNLQSNGIEPYLGAGLEFGSNGELTISAATIQAAVPAASTTVAGRIEIATAQEVAAASNGTLALTSGNLATALNDTTTAGGNAMQKAVVNAVEVAIAADPGAKAAIAAAVASDAAGGVVDSIVDSAADQAKLAAALVDDIATAVAASAPAQATLAASLVDDLGATAAETIAGTIDNKLVSPADLSAALQQGAAYTLHTAHEYAGTTLIPTKTNLTFGAVSAEARSCSCDGSTLAANQGAIYDGAGALLTSAALGYSSGGTPTNSGVKTALLARSLAPDYLAAHITGDVYAPQGAWVFGGGHVGDDGSVDGAALYSTLGALRLSSTKEAPIITSTPNARGQIRFHVGASGAVGEVFCTPTGVAYNTISDYRLKTVDGPVANSGAFIDALKPYTGEWKAQPGKKANFFLAHEVQEVSPSSVTGEKDAVDKTGKPVMQSMEYGSADFIVNIIAELQSLRKRVAALEAKK